MKIAIHNRLGSFSDRWIEYCKNNNIPFKVVNCYDNDIINQLCDCDALMWHHHHENYKDVLAAKKILFALEHAGVKIFKLKRGAGSSNVKLVKTKKEAVKLTKRAFDKEFYF